MVEIRRIIFGVIASNFNRLKTLLNSFKMTCSKNLEWIIVVADRTCDAEITKYLDELSVDFVISIIHINCTNLPYSKSYNYIFEVMHYLTWDYAFMVRDFVSFRQVGWDIRYIEASLNNNIPFLVHYNTKIKPPNIRPIYNKSRTLESITTSQVSMGFLFTLTPEVLQKVGFFNERFECDGHEDQEYNIRCCHIGFNNLKSLFDIADSIKYISITLVIETKKLDIKGIENNKKLRDIALSKPIFNLTYQERPKYLKLFNCNKIKDENWKDVGKLNTITNLEQPDRNHTVSRKIDTSSNVINQSISKTTSIPNVALDVPKPIVPIVKQEVAVSAPKMPTPKPKLEINRKPNPRPKGKSIKVQPTLNKTTTPQSNSTAPPNKEIDLSKIECPNISFSQPIPSNNQVCAVIPVLGRHRVLLVCIESIKRQTVPTDVVLAVSTDEDIQFAQKIGVKYVTVQNNPLSRKFQALFDYVKTMENIDHVLLVGSDDLLQDNWVERCLVKMKEGFDVVGRNAHYFYDHGEHKRYYRQYIGKKLNYLPAHVKENWSLGAGRLFSRKILDTVNWNLYNFSADKGLDKKSGEILVNAGARFGLVNDTEFLSIRDDWGCITKITEIIASKDKNIFKQIDNYPNSKLVDLENLYTYIIWNSQQLGQSSNLFDYYNIAQTHVSRSIEFFKENFKKFYNLADLHDKNKPCLFFGVYNDDDYNLIKEHKGQVHILWGGTDCDVRFPKRKLMVNKIKILPEIRHFVSSQNLQDRLIKEGIKSEKIMLNLTRSELFRPPKSLGKKIYIYNGRNPKNAHIYGDTLCTQLMQKLPNYEYLLSSNVNLSYEKMPDVYKDCFVGVRLTTNDASALTVQEMGLMGIPVIHNGRHANSISWKNIDDITKTIVDLSKINRKKIIVVIYTFNRPNFLHNLLYSLEYQQLDELAMEVIVYNDGSLYKYVNYKPQNYVVTYRHFLINHGKDRWYQFISNIYGDLKKEEFDYVLFLADDMQINPATIGEAIRLYDTIKDPKKVGMNLVNDRNLSWTNFTQVSHNEDVNQCQWLEMSFICDPNYFEALGWEIKNFYKRSHVLSSGVPGFISITLDKMEKTMFVPKKSIAYNSFFEHKSQMYLPNKFIDASFLPTQDVVNNIGYRLSSFYLNPSKLIPEKSLMVASLCSIPSRVQSLEDTINSILPNADYLHVFLNNYDTVPNFLNHPKIIVARSQDYGDLGDCNKFFWADKIENCYHFVCDDDLIYTEKYFRYHLEKIKQTDHKIIFSFAGAKIDVPQPELSSYYSGRTQIHISTSRQNDIPVHICGTGALAYHTSAIKISRFDFKHKNMADIWFSIVAKQQKVPLRAISYKDHIDEYIVQSKKYDPTDTIYYHSRRLNDDHEMNTADVQTEVVKSNYPWELF